MDSSGKGKNGNIAGPFDGHGYLPLMFCTVSRDSSGNDLPPLCDKISQNLWIFIIDIHFLIRTESADLSSHERLFLLIRSWFFHRFFHSFLLIVLTFRCVLFLQGPAAQWQPPLSGSDFSLQGFASDVDVVFQPPLSVGLFGGDPV